MKDDGTNQSGGTNRRARSGNRRPVVRIQDGGDSDQNGAK